MSNWPVSSQVRTTVHPGGATYNTTLTANAVTNTKGAWAEITASSGDDAYGVVVQLFPSGSLSRYLIDLGIGAALSEIVVVADMHWAVGRAVERYFKELYIPLYIPAATRIAGRCQANVTLDTCNIQIQLLKPGMIPGPMFGRATTYGAAAADSGGTPVDCGATANTKGTPAQLVASTTNAMKAMMVCIGNNANAVESTGNFLCDIMVGAAAAEVVLSADLHLRSDAAGDSKVPQYFFLYADVPSGTRLSARGASSITDATDRLFDVVVIGFD